MINKDFCSKWAGEANGAARVPEGNRTEILSPANEQYKGRRAAVPDGSKRQGAFQMVEGRSNCPSGVPEVPGGSNGPSGVPSAQSAVPGSSNGFRGLSDKERVEALVAAVEAAQQDIAPSYNDWLGAGIALASALGEEGRTLFHRISRFYAGYNYHECDKKYNDCLRDSSPAYSLGTLFHLAKQAGIQVAQSGAKQETYTPPYHAAATQSGAKQEAYTLPYHAAAAQSQASYAAPFPASANTASAENTMPKNKSKKQNRIATIIDFFNRKFHHFEDLRHDVLSGKFSTERETHSAIRKTDGMM